MSKRKPSRWVWFVLAVSSGAGVLLFFDSSSVAQLVHERLAVLGMELPSLSLTTDPQLRWVALAVAALGGLCLAQFTLLDWRSGRLRQRLIARQAALEELEARLATREKDRDDLAREYSSLRDRHRELVEDANELSYRHDLEGKLQDINEWGASALGWAREDLIGCSVDELLAPDSRERSRLAVGRLVAKRGVAHETLVLLDRGGRPQWYDVALRLEAGDGVVKAVEVVGRDVSDRHREDLQRAAQSRLLAALSESETEAAAMASAARILCRELHWEYGEIWWQDAEFGVLRCVGSFAGADAAHDGFAERAAVRTFGKGLGVAGRGWSLGRVLLIGELAALPDCASITEAAGFRSALAIPIGDGALVEGVAVLFDTREGATSVVPDAHLEQLGTHIYQLRKRKTAERALRGSEARKQAILESALDCILTVDADRRVLEFNPAAERTFGYRRAEVLGKVVDDLIIPPDEREAHRAGFERFLATGTRVLSERVEMTAQRADGTTLPVEIAITPIHVGERPVFTAHLRDITDRKEIERLKDELVSTVSHELRTPLASMRGFVELLLFREYPPDEQKRFLGIIDEEIRRLGRLIDDFLDLQRLEAGALDYELKETDLLPLAREVFDGFRDSHEGHDFELEALVDALPVRIDADRMRQVLLNLLSNAVKYSPDGGCIRLTLTGELDQARVLVEDEGIGMDAATLANLFTKFYRADHSVTRRVGGTGLGLALVREIVEAHGGDVQAASDLGEGSCFTFSLPMPSDTPAETAA